MQHTHTPWTKKAKAPSSSSLPSDRLRPRAPSTKPSPSKPQDKPAPRSKTVRALDALLAALRAPAPPPAEPCYCQARRHALSPHTPLCTHCGLVLCALHPAPAPCPSCAAPLLSPPARAALLARLEAERADALAAEDDARQRAREATQAAAGAFPALPGAAPRAGGREVKVHKVLSLDPTTKRATLAAYRSAPPPPSPRPDKEEEAEEEEERVERVPPPPAEVPHVAAPRAGARWADLRARGVGAVYVAGGGGAGSASRGR